MSHRREPPVSQSAAAWRPEGNTTLAPSDPDLWHAWQRLNETETTVNDVMGEHFGRRLLVLWAMARLGECGSAADPVLADLIDDDMQPRFRDWMLEDVALLAFALGAGWSISRAPAPPANQKPTSADASVRS
jgi:hypothetical protein